MVIHWITDFFTACDIRRVLGVFAQGIFNSYLKEIANYEKRAMEENTAQNLV